MWLGDVAHRYPLTFRRNRSDKIMPRGKALAEFRELLYYRGAVPTKEGQVAISQKVFDREIARGLESKGVYLKCLGYFVDGLEIGTEQFIRDQLAVMWEKGGAYLSHSTE